MSLLGGCSEIGTVVGAAVGTVVPAIVGAAVGAIAGAVLGAVLGAVVGTVVGAEKVEGGLGRWKELGGGEWIYYRSLNLLHMNL